MRISKLQSKATYSSLNPMIRNMQTESSSATFIYVKDVISACLFFMQNRQHSGIYNIGTGAARSFLDLTTSVFTALGRRPKIEFIEMPQNLRASYQYYTQAEISKLKQIGYDQFHTLEEGVRDYICNYLSR